MERADLRARFVGTWTLVRAEYRYADGRRVNYLGEGATGLLMYDAHGNMSVHLMQANRPAFAANDRLGGTCDEIRAAFESYHAYFGTYTVDERECEVGHQLAGCTFPNWLGSTQRRRYTFDGNRLTLTTPPILLHDAPAVGTLLWERIS